MNIFSILPKYATKWAVKSSRAFTTEEIAAIDSAVVVDSQYGSSVAFFMRGGGQTYIPLSTTSSLSVGSKVDLASAKLLILGKEGEADIYRVEA
jgi:hypothetical protein